MAKGVFMAAVSPSYDDLPEVRYHFPRKYFNLAKQCEGDWILYYEPRQGGGRLCYFATARVDRIEQDRHRSDHYYAHMTDYLEFPEPVPYREGSNYYESRLRKTDGSPNKGLLGWAIHHLADHEYQTILTLGMGNAKLLADVGEFTGEEQIPPMIRDRPLVEQISLRPYRDRAFSTVVRSAYNYTCAFTGLHLVNGGGRVEVDAAHIRAVEDHGPDSPRNGLTLSKTVHWLFDRGMISLEDDGKILKAEALIPAQLRTIFNQSGYANLPDKTSLRPHPQFLRYHRDTRYKG